MGRNVTEKLIASHLLEGDLTPGAEIALRIDQTLTQDAAGTMVMLELEAMHVDRLQTELSVQYVDHNLLQEDERNAEDHLFLYSGTADDQVCLVSPETAAASALAGVIADPREIAIPYPRIAEPVRLAMNLQLLLAPLPADAARKEPLIKGPNIAPLPEFDELPDTLNLPVLLRVGDNISTDEILLAGSKVLPYRSNIPEISEFVFRPIDEDYASRARERGEHAIVAGHNYGQGSSREHAALAPRSLGLRLVLAKSFARIHCQNLLNFGILPLVFAEEEQYDLLQQDSELSIDEPVEQLRCGPSIEVRDAPRGETFEARHKFSTRQIAVLAVGGMINYAARRAASAAR